MNRVAGSRWCVMSLGVLLGALAQAETTVGRTEGDAGVSPTGAARYTIPLTLPPGTHGLAPSLAITYDSRGGNGLLGVGFRLSGLSQISRCGNTLAQDGKLGAVALDWSDRFCLDGLRLRLTTGSYGAAGSQYQTEVETFARVTALGSAGVGPASFRVERRDGLIYEYGATDDSRVESSGSTTAREWAVNRIRDRDGNYADVVYAEGSTSGEHRPLRIDYAGNLLTGAAPYYSVRFVYELRPSVDVPTRYVAAGVLSEPRRLDRIDVVQITTGRIVRSFDLAYAAPGATGRSRLDSLRECAGSSCWPPTQFGWTAVSAGWSVNMSVTLPAASYASSLPGDIDGDGFDDIAYQDSTTRQWAILRGGPHGFQYPAVNTGLGADSVPTQAITADVDGDGRREILVPGGGNDWHRLHRTSSGAYAYNAMGIINPSPPGGLIAADIDGDGRDDLVYVKSDGNAIHWRRNQTVTATSYAVEAVLWSVPAGMRLPAAPFIESSQRFRSIVRSGDFNGDGRVDLLVLAQQSTCGTTPTCTTWTNRWTVLASTGTRLVPQYTFDGNAESLLADFNADGLTDIGYSPTGGQWRLLLGTGARGGSLAGFSAPVSSGAEASPAGARAMIIDWDADGRADLLQPTATGTLQYCRSTGATFEPCQPAGITPGTVPSSPMTLDINGDGYPDLVYSASGIRLHLHHQVPQDTLVSATDGLGARTDFEYAIANNPAVHAVGSGSVFPVRDLARLGHVVSRMTRASASGPQQETYYYEGAKGHVQGRGFLGFARRTATPSNGSPVRVEDYLQDPAEIATLGAPSQTTLQQRSGAPLVRTSYVWGRHNFGVGQQTRAFAYPSQVTTERYELDGTGVSSTTATNIIDVFGTAVRRDLVTIERSKGSNPGAAHFETTTLAGVVNDTVNWCLGRPATAQVTRWHTLPGGAQVTRSFGQAWDYVRCRVMQQVVEPSSDTLRVTTDLAYDAYGNPGTVSTTPAAQPVRATSYTWAENGRFLRTTTNPEGHVETIAWDSALAQPVAITSPNGLVTNLQYDDFGRPIRQSGPDGTSTTVMRAFCGASCVWPGTSFIVSSTKRGNGDAQVSTLETGYDIHGREVYARRERPGGSQSFRVLGYDSRGLVARESLPAPCCAAPGSWVVHAYDALGRRISTERPTSQSVATPVVNRWSHDGLVVTATDPLGRATTHRLDALGRVLQVVDPASTDTDYEYDAFGNLVTVRDFAGSSTVIGYDVRGFRRSISDPSAGRWTYDYFPLGEVRSHTNARGQSTTFSYDRLSRPVTRTEPEGKTTWTWGKSVSSRNVGALASVVSPGFRESYQYDALGRPATVTTTIAGVTLVTRQSYDTVTGLPDTLTYPASTGTSPLRVRRHYDRGRLVRLSDADTGASYWQMNGVDDAGHVTDETLGNGVRVASDYDAITGLLVGRTSGPGGSSEHQDLLYAWDSLGNLVWREERNLGVQEQYHYDARDRLDYVLRNGSVVLDLGYDDAGNITYKSDVGDYRYDVNRRSAVVAAGANAYAYDANGAVVSASGTTISWQSFDLPGQVNHPGGNYSAFYYGPDRARYRQVARAGGISTETLYAAGGLFERVTTGGATSYRHYLHADGRRVAVHTRSSTSSPSTVYLLEDHQGGVDGFTSTSGALLGRNSYQPHGARRSGDWLAGAPTAAEWQQIKDTTSRGYTDHEHLDNLGLIHMNGRVYDPVLGRFLSPDALVQAPYDSQSLNRYSYVRNNPLRFSDPTGFCFNTSAPLGPHPAACLETIVVTSDRWPRSGSWWDLVMPDVGGRGGMLGRPGERDVRGGPGVRPGAPDPAPPPVTGPADVVATVTASRLSFSPSFGLAPVLPGHWLLQYGMHASRALLTAGAAGTIAAALAAPAVTSDTSDLLDDQGNPHYVYHFTNDVGKRGISDSGLLMPGGSGLIYFSALPYPDATQAQSALSLPRAPSGYFLVPRSNIRGPLTWSVVAPNFGQPGGGLEASASGSVPLAGARWVSIGP